MSRLDASRKLIWPLHTLQGCGSQETTQQEVETEASKMDQTTAKTDGGEMTADKNQILQEEREEMENGETTETQEPSTLKSYMIGIGKFIAILALLYTFICSITFLEDAFKLLSGKYAGKTNPFHLYFTL